MTSESEVVKSALLSITHVLGLNVSSVSDEMERKFALSGLKEKSNEAG